MHIIDTTDEQVQLLAVKLGSSEPHNKNNYIRPHEHHIYQHVLVLNTIEQMTQMHPNLYSRSKPNSPVISADVRIHQNLHGLFRPVYFESTRTSLQNKLDVVVVATLLTTL